MINCTHLFAHQVADLARAVATTSHSSHPRVALGEETRARIVETLRERGPMTAAEIGRTIGRTRKGTLEHLHRMAAEDVMRVRRTSDKYNAPWEAA